MATNRKELEAQIAALQEQLKNADAEERGNDLKTVKDLCKKHGFSSSAIGKALKDADLVAAAKKSYKSQQK